jgi:hypothetical protein
MCSATQADNFRFSHRLSHICAYIFLTRVRDSRSYRNMRIIVQEKRAYVLAKPMYTGLDLASHRAYIRMGMTGLTDFVDL